VETAQPLRHSFSSMEGARCSCLPFSLTHSHRHSTKAHLPSLLPVNNFLLFNGIKTRHTDTQTHTRTRSNSIKGVTRGKIRALKWEVIKSEPKNNKKETQQHRKGTPHTNYAPSYSVSLPNTQQLILWLSQLRQRWTAKVFCCLHRATQKTRENVKIESTNKWHAGSDADKECFVASPTWRGRGSAPVSQTMMRSCILFVVHAMNYPPPLHTSIMPPID
jgi:hypothetical protein